MKNLSLPVSKTLSFYYLYVEYLRALINNEIPKKLGWGHYFAIACNYSYRPKSYDKVFEIAKNHFPKIFLISGWKGIVLELLGKNLKDYRPSLKLLAYSIKNESSEKRDEFFKDLYAVMT